MKPAAGPLDEDLQTGSPSGRSNVFTVGVTLLMALVAAYAGISISSVGMRQIRLDRDRLRATIAAVHGFEPSDPNATPADLVHRFLDASVLTRLADADTEVAERLTSLVVAFPASAPGPAGESDVSLRELWSFYAWYHGYVERHAEAYTRFVWLFIIGMVVSLAVVVSSRALVLRVRADHEKARAYARRQLELLELGQRDLMMELHDQVGQQLASVALQISSLLDTGRQSEEASRALNRSVEMIRDCRASVRSLAKRLRPAELDQLGLESALRELVADYERPDYLRLLLSFAPDAAPAIRPDDAIHVFRIVQEGVTNAALHSGADRLDVSVSVAGSTVWVVVKDNGCGFATHGGMPKGMGFVNMSERATIIGGTVAILSRPGKGTTVSLQFPAVGRV